MQRNKQKYNKYMRSYMRKYRKKNPITKSQYRKWELKKRYGLSVEEYNSMLLSQNSCCALCNISLINKIQYVDHEHSSGLVRGIVCPGCNILIGCIDKLLAMKLITKVLRYCSQIR